MARGRPRLWTFSQAKSCRKQGAFPDSVMLLWAISSKSPVRLQASLCSKRYWTARSEANALVKEIAATQVALSSETDPVRQECLLERLSKLDMDLEAAGGGYREHEAKAILLGLGFAQDDFLRPMSEFSGGWVMRASLAKILYRRPNLFAP